MRYDAIFAWISQAICSIEAKQWFFPFVTPEYLVKTTDLSQVTDKRYHIMLYTSL
jgi:hypothetical protein